MNQYAIRRESTQFLGPFRCQACITRNSDCVVNKQSTTCDICNSEAQCLFTRSVSMKRTDTIRNFSWDELNGDIALQKSAQHLQGSPQSSRTLNEREGIYVRGDPYPSHGLNDSEESNFAHSPFATASPYNNEYSPPVTARVPDQASRDDRWRTRYPPMPSDDRLPSIHDSLSNIDPRITPSEFEAQRNRLPASFDKNDQYTFNAQNLQSSGENQTINPSRLSDIGSHDFILENFDTASGSMESRRGKRRGKLSESSAFSASRLRAIGACWKCKLQKNQCSTEDPCIPCIRTLKVGRYCPPCYRGQLPDLLPWLFWGRRLTPECVKAPKYTRELSAGVQKLLAEAKKQDDGLLNIALDIYESTSSAEMLGHCGIILREIETLSYKNKHLALPQFFCICIIDMLSRAMELAAGAGASETTQVSHKTSSGITLKKNEGLEVLFGLIKTNGPFDPFVTISKATESKSYNRDRHGTHLVSYVETCIFKLKPTPRPAQDIDSLRMGNSPSLDSLSLMGRDLPDRSTDSQSQHAKSQAAGKQRAARSQDQEEIDEDSDDDYEN